MNERSQVNYLTHVLLVMSNDQTFDTPFTITSFANLFPLKYIMSLIDKF